MYVPVLSLVLGAQTHESVADTTYYRYYIISGRPNNVLVVNYLVSVVNYLAKTVPASDALSAIPAKTNCFGQITSVSAENYSFKI